MYESIKNISTERQNYVRRIVRTIPKLQSTLLMRMTDNKVIHPDQANDISILGPPELSLGAEEHPG